MEFLAGIDWESFWIGVVTTFVAGTCGALLLYLIGEG